MNCQPKYKSMRWKIYSQNRLFAWRIRFIQKQDVQILKALVLGEEERGQSQYQVMCFVTKFIKSEFISTDAMAKLRQVSSIQLYITPNFDSVNANNLWHYSPHFHFHLEKSKYNTTTGGRSRSWQLYNDWLGKIAKINAS